MPGRGFGFGRRVAPSAALAAAVTPTPTPAPTPTPTPTPTPAPLLGNVAPSAGFTGTAGSGFGGAYGAVPVNPTRTTAKPACRLLVPPFQFYTDNLLIGVMAGANYNGSLLDNLGLEKVIVHVEGTQHEITQPSFQTFADFNGNPVTYLGWWCRLQHNGVNGKAAVYFEAVAKDTTMQRRVQGPYYFYPNPVVHQHDIQVAPSLPVIAGQRYQSLAAANAYLTSQSARNPRITFIESGVYDFSGGASFTEGWWTYEASVPVTFRGPANPTFTSTGTASYNAIFRTLRFRGSNITIDMLGKIELYQTSAVADSQPWFDGVTITDSAGRDALWRGRPKLGFLGWTIRGNPYFTECTFTNLGKVAVAASLARGNVVSHCHEDIFGDGLCVIGNRTTDHDSNFFNAHILALQVTYSGAEATATFARDAAGVTITWGANSDFFAVTDSDAAYLANTNYTVQNVATWINGHAGWSATVLDNTRHGACLCLNGGRGGGVSAQNCKGVTLNLYTAFDLHADWYQKGDAGTLENVIGCCNTATGIVAQDLFLAGAMRDTLFFNNAFFNTLGSEDGLSQFNRTHNHVVVAHNTFATQGIALRNDAGQNYNPDAYCLLANNACIRIFWGGATDADLAIRSNHIDAGMVDAGGAIGTTVGGNYASNYVAAATGDFRPAGALLANPKAPQVRYDLARAERGTTASAGALA